MGTSPVNRAAMEDLPREAHAFARHRSGRKWQNDDLVRFDHDPE
jgi:DNA-directed RNA polymerase specialized sigma24 family protein